MGRFPIDNPRTDDIVAFHHFRAPVSLDGEVVIAGVSVAEDNCGNLVRCLKDERPRFYPELFNHLGGE